MIDEIDEDELPRTNPYRPDDLLDPDWFAPGGGSSDCHG